MIPLTLRLSRDVAGNILVRSNRDVPYRTALSMHFTHYNRHICDESGDRWDLPIRKGNNVEMVVEDEHPAEGYVLDVRGRVRIVKFNGERHTLGKTERILKAGDTLKILRVDHIDDTLLEDVA